VNSLGRRYIGASIARDSVKRLVAGRGTFVDDIVLPRMLHAAFARSPFAHARITRIDASKAARNPGIALVLTGKELEPHVSGWQGVLGHIPALRSAMQRALPVERACWQGEPVAMVVAETRAQAEDAVEAIEIEWEALPAVATPETALDPDTPVIHPGLGSNLAFERRFETGDVAAAMTSATVRVERTFRFDRQTGVTPEPRAILADFSAAEERLTVYHSGQTPHVMQAMLAKHLNVDEHRVRVVCKDVGGGYGVKIHVYGDEIATAAAAKLLRRPVKFIADRLESFVTDIHARGHRVRARMGLDHTGRILAFEIDGLMEIGAYSAYPRASVHEVNQMINMCGAAYDIVNYRASGKVVFQNKNITSQLRAVGHPMLTTVCEGMVDFAAAAAGIDPAEIRRCNLIPDNAYPRITATGRKFDGNSHQASLRKLLELMDYKALRDDQRRCRSANIQRGIGIATFVESTAPGPTIYGSGDVSISAQDSTTLSLEPSGAIICAAGVTEQGQGTHAMLAQVTADAVGVPLECVRVVTGDTDRIPYGGGAWGSRQAAVGGEATWSAGRALRANILAVAGRLLQAAPEELDIANGIIVDRSGRDRLTLAEIARIAFYRGAELPDDLYPELRLTRSFRPVGDAHAYTNGMHAAHLEVDVETGFVRLLGYWVVEDCGTMVNPLLVDEQVRGGVAMGLGWALLEQCVYDSEGQMLNGTMADYLVPLAGDVPDIRIVHVATPTPASQLGIKGAGESGVIGAPAAVLNAVNDALRPFGAQLSEIPITPRRILAALESR
jgi:aerobic carbon-monoxide dehydrogenase large subunit